MMENWQIESALLAAHNIADALGWIASALGFVAAAICWYPWLGGFASRGTREKPFRVQILKD